jgi:hypothetical protein
MIKTDDLKKDLEGSGRGLTKVLFQHSACVAEKNHNIISVFAEKLENFHNSTQNIHQR